MGCYINPKLSTKEEWLKDHAVSESLSFPAIIPDDCLPVCLVDNGPFKAAGVAFNEREVNEFNNPNDGRFKVWYIVSKEKLLTVSNLADYLK